MASTYKTPGVYVEEVSLFPASIAQVETAVPAFIGYTQVHAKFGEDLLMKPTKIRSLAEYEEMFGGAPPTKVESVELDASDNVTSTKLANGFLLYDSLRMFFANGGAKCYIISIGAYPDSTSGISDQGFLDGLAVLEKEDEPTLILFPDAIFLASDKIISLQQQALAQAAKLGDRFCILDVRPNEKDGSGNVIADFEDKAEEFRNAIGVNNLKYGACYGPYLRANFNKKITYRDIKGQIERAGSTVGLAALTPEPATKKSIELLEHAISDVDEFTKKFPDLTALELSFLEKENLFKTKINDGSNIGPQRTAYKNLVLEAYKPLKTQIDEIVNNNGTPPFASGILDSNGKSVRFLIEDVKAAISDSAPGVLHSAASTLLSLKAHAARTGDNLSNIDPTLLSNAGWGTFQDGAVDDFYPTDTGGLSGDDKEAAEQANMKAGAAKAAKAFKSILAELKVLGKTAKAYESTYESALIARFPLFKMIIERTQNTITDLPPSAAIAGVYSTVDSNRGVHKAPANVSLNSVVGLTDIISHEQQENLNVDVVAGKSINVIRPFVGKGILVWGARTLAGNDNEWRYVSVRRFFNMVEESAKKATEQYVFEPNDGNTWVKVKAMIENFLINQWRIGALAGSTPDQAFFVKVGLNQTMTAQDVLEGKMIVEIGMAAVRPAEFIILRFSHKMQEA